MSARGDVAVARAVAEHQRPTGSVVEAYALGGLHAAPAVALMAAQRARAEADYAEDWPDDVPPPEEAPRDDADAEMDALAALWREKQRSLGIDAAPKPATWEPRDALSVALWRALPTNGAGVEYTRLVRQVAADRWPLHHVRVALLGLVLIGKAYVEPGPNGCSLAGRGTDPRVGVHAYRTGAMERLS